MSKADFLEYLQIKKDLEGLQSEFYRPAQYGFEYKNWPVIKAIQGKKDYEIAMMDWEFRPFWVRNMEEMKLIRKGIDPKTKKQGTPIPWLNAKAENLLTSKMWRPAALERRCIVPSEYFFEWRHHYPIGKRGQVLKTPERFPYVIKPKTNTAFAGMAAIWTPWKNHDTGETIDTFAILTTEPPAGHIMRMIHNSKNRMPTYLTEEIAEAWLWGKLTEADITAFASYQWPSEQFEYHTVKKDFLTAEDPLVPEAFPGLETPKDLFSL